MTQIATKKRPEKFFNGLTGEVKYAESRANTVNRKNLLEFSLQKTYTKNVIQQMTREGRETHLIVNRGCKIHQCIHLFRKYKKKQFLTYT